MRPGLVEQAVRRSIWLFLACAVVLLGTVLPAAARGARSAPAEDSLAYVSGGKLYAGYPSPHLVAGPGNAFEPAFSYDGKWLVYLRQRWQGYDGSSQLWLARADGSDAHPVTPMGGITSDQFGAAGFLWSPTADVLAVQPADSKGDLLPIELLPVQGKPRAVPDGLYGSFLWLADGKTLAIVAASRNGNTRLVLVRGVSVHTYSVPGIGRFDPIELAAWWPAARSIVYWLDRGGCFSCIADGTPLEAFDLSTGRTRRLGIGLVYRDWVTVHGPYLTFVAGRPRSAFYGKHLEVCTAAGRCRVLAGLTSGQIAVDPSVSPAGGEIAFDVAPAWNTGGFLSGARYRRWLDQHILWIADPDGLNAHPVAGVPPGALDPVWTRDGRGIIFVKDGALWGDVHVGAANAVAFARGRLVRSDFVPNLQNPAFQNWYYGHMNWRDLFAWS